VADISMAIPILEGIARPKRLIADKAYDADKLRAFSDWGLPGQAAPC
jgi:hypothetical protein